MAPVAASDSNGVAVSKRAARVSSPAPRTAKEDDKTTTVAGIAAATCPGDEDVALKHGAEEPLQILRRRPMRRRSRRMSVALLGSRPSQLAVARAVSHPWGWFQLPLSQQLPRIEWACSTP
eukprot:TRINITY_DN2431_c0_g4_i2.p3 TRINITY_DN2431_c0_g4~~TRINITY_DN2431_c0_g4_i2.p3  ORF type:complete len:140 (+),score=31.98 TRINITY_DN2431_c0_g4_i2:58-420(+)